MRDYRLCFVRDQWAYFTDRMATQRGEDWWKVPYEHNASLPFCDKPGQIIKVAFDGEFEQPCTYNENSRFSAEQMNKQMYPWLRTDRLAKAEHLISIYAGVTVEEFIGLIYKGGGRAYLELDPWDVQPKRSKLSRLIRFLLGKN